jgi:bifunctional non-homologous end joining protein LigD
MHIYIPLEGKYSYQRSQLFANIIVKLVHEQIPDLTTLERSIAARKGKMYLDFLQNNIDKITIHEDTPSFGRVERSK